MLIRTSYPSGKDWKSWTEHGPGAAVCQRPGHPGRGPRPSAMGQQKAGRKTDRSAVVHPAPDALEVYTFALPQFAADVPGTITIIGEDMSLAEIAEIGLDLGMIEEADWDSDLMLSIKSGLARWSKEFGLSEKDDGLVHLAISLDWPSENNWGEDPFAFTSDWRRERGAASYLPVNMIGLVAQGYREVFVERAVRALEDLHPGAGYAVLSLINRALWWTVGGVTIPWVKEDLESRDEDEDEGQFYDGYLTLKKWKPLIPAEAMETEFDPQIFRAALKSASSKSANLKSAKLSASELQPPGACDMRAVLQQAILLSGLIKPLACDIGFFENMESVLPVAVRWNPEDRIDEVSDGYHDMIANCGTETDLCFVRCFQSGKGEDDPGSTHAAMKAARAACRIIGGASKLIDMVGVTAAQLAPQRVRV